MPPTLPQSARYLPPPLSPSPASDPSSAAAGCWLVGWRVRCCGGGEGRRRRVPVHGSRGRKKGRLEAVAACCAPWAFSSLLFFCIPPRPHRARKGGRGLRQKQKSFGKRDAARHASSNSAEVADGASEWRKKRVRCVGLFPLPAGKRGIARKLASFIHLPPPSHVCKDSGWLGGRREEGKGGRGSRMLLLMRDMQHCRRKRRGRKKGGALAGREREMVV